MYLPRRISLKGLVEFGWQQVTFFGIYSGLICYFVKVRGVEILAIHQPPLAALTTATAILLGFRNNSAYQRWWEARKIWGGVLNESRTFGIRVTTLVAPGNDSPEAADLRRRMIRGHLAYIWALNLQLRPRKEGWDTVRNYLAEDERDRLELVNKATALAQLQGERIAAARAKGWIDAEAHRMLLNTVGEHITLQGKAERIAGTPLPRHYAFFTTIFVWIFVLMIPLAMVDQLAWQVVPVAMLIGWIFTSAEQVGRYTEDPFADFKHDVPMDTLCRKAEIDMLQQLGETDIPPPLEPVNGVLM